MSYLVASRRSPPLGRMGIMLANGAGAGAIARSNMLRFAPLDPFSSPPPVPPVRSVAPPIVTVPVAPPPILMPSYPPTYPPTVSPMPRVCPAWGCGPAPIRIISTNGSNGGMPVPLPPVVRPPVSAPPPILPPAASANAGTPVPAGYPTSQIFVDPAGGFWQYSSSKNQWVSVGTPYNTGATAIPPAVPTGSTPSAPTSLTTPTAAPAPVNISVAAPTSTYQEILAWLEQDTLGSTVGFSSIPNWIVVAAAGALAWKFSQPAGRR